MNTPEHITFENFLCGAEGPEPWCRQHFSDYIDDIDCVWDEDSITSLCNGYFLSPSSDSMLLLFHQDNGLEVVGYYNTPGAVCIQDVHQGKGLGAELILATYEWCGAPPTEGFNEQCFSISGYAAHQTAYRLGLSRGLFQTKSPKP